jgi:ribose transport system ATP-binding protein
VRKASLLVARGIEKRFAGVHALKGVDLEVAAGEVLAIVGENGAGKSTLMKILAGVLAADAGAITIDGARAALDSPLAARRLGIALIHQELQLAENLDVAENVFLGCEPCFGRTPFVDAGRMRREAAALLARVGLEVDTRTRVSDLSLGQRQLVEIAKALAADARVLIMDEPTSSLSDRETRHLFRIAAELKSRGVAILYISHRMPEILALADRVVVLRDGERAGELEGATIERDAIVRLMVGRDLVTHASRSSTRGAKCLEVEALRTAAFPQHAVSFDVARGEIVGIAGLVGAGRSELLLALFGIVPPLGGSIRVSGEVFRGARGPRAAIDAGIALVPEDRKREGVLLELPIDDNLALPSLQTLAGTCFRRHRSERAFAHRVAGDVAIRANSLRRRAAELSGGNQQKVVIGKWLAKSPRLLLLDEPTRGVDVAAKAEIYALLERHAEAGNAVLFVSSELEEVLRLADRVLVMHEGRLAGELSRAAASEEAILRLATGGDLGTSA